MLSAEIATIATVNTPEINKHAPQLLLQALSYRVGTRPLYSPIGMSAMMLVSLDKL